MENLWGLRSIYNYIIEYFWPPETQQSVETSTNDQTDRQLEQTPTAAGTRSLFPTNSIVEEYNMLNWWGLRIIYNLIIEYFWPKETHQSEETSSTNEQVNRQSEHAPTGTETLCKAEKRLEIDKIGQDHLHTDKQDFEIHQLHSELYLEKNPFVTEITQNPQLYEIKSVTQLEQESVNSRDFTSLTSCFRFIIESQGINSPSDVRKFSNKLYKCAFNSIKSGKTGGAWTKLDLISEIDENCFDFWHQKGIFVDTKFYVDDDKTYPMMDGYKLVAEIFYEWFAAHYVKQIAEDRPGILDKTLKAIDPASHQYVYRFACGLSNICAGKILKYLKTDGHWTDLALLCMVEQSELAEDFEKSIRRLCSTITEMKDEDSVLMERSKLQLMKIATWKKIPIQEILLMGCFSSVNLQLETIVLKSGQELPKGLSVKELRIQQEDHLTAEHVTDILHFATKCKEIEALGFDDCNEDIPIEQIDSELMERIRLKKLQIEWFSRNRGGNHLNLQSGRFELQQDE